MGYVDQIKKDIEQLTGDLDGFGVQLNLTAPDSKTASVVGLHAKHHTDFDDDGRAVNTTIASVAVSEQFLIDAGYPVRTKGEVNLKNHRISAPDSTGATIDYTIRQWFPDETIGLIILILGTYDSSE